METIEVGINIDATPNVVYDHLANPPNLMGLQKLLIEVSPVREEIKDGRRVLHYYSVEAFRLFGITVYKNKIEAVSTLIEPNVRFDTTVESPGGVHLDVEYHFEARDSGTHLREIMHIQAPSVLMGFVKSEALRVQREVMARLKARLEAQASPDRLEPIR